MKKVIVLLLLVTFLKEMVFAGLVPIWHTPDEQAHFAEVAFYSEKGFYPISGNDLNKEIYTSESLMGTNRDKNGNNKFTFHPDYKIEYTNSQTGKYEDQIKNLPVSFRTEFVGQEAAGYPPLYYTISSLFYKIFYNSDLFVRVFVVRFFSIILGVLLVYLAYLIGKEVFPDNELLQITLPLFVSFQPMVSFVSAGVNSDNLMNVLFTCFIYLMVLLVRKGLSLNLVLVSALNTILLFLTKPQFVFALPILVLALILSVRNKRLMKILLGFLLLVGVLIVYFGARLEDLLINVAYLGSFSPGGHTRNSLTLIQYAKNTLAHTYAEVLPWYWGVFDWLGVVLPRLANKIINWSLVVAGFGFLVGLYKIIKRGFEKQDILKVFLVLSALIYFAGISYYDYLFILGHYFSFGIQGRYFFPAIVPEMFILVFGFWSLFFGKLSKYKSYFVKLFSVLLVLLNFVALWTIAKTYYDMTNFGNFVNQASQYKVGIFKGGWWEVWIILYLVALVIFLFRFLKLVPVKQVGKRSSKI